MKALSTNLIENLTSRDWWQSWITIIFGCALMATAFVLFINPYQIVPGGVYGASIVLNAIFPNIMVGTFGYMFDIPLLCLSVLFLGKRLGARTIVAALLTPAFMNLFTYLCYPAEAINTLEASKLLGGVLDLSNHLLVSTLIGSVLIGIACALIVKSKATSGGTDIVAMIMQKYLGIKFSTSILIADGTVVLAGLVVNSCDIGAQGDPQRGVLLSLYSLIAIYVVSHTVSIVLSGNQNDKIIFVVSSKGPEEIRNFILNDLDRTATCIKASGLYSRENKDMLFLVVSNKEADAVKHKIREYDPTAFVVVTSASATYGEGWSTLPTPDDIIPE